MDLDDKPDSSVMAESTDSEISWMQGAELEEWTKRVRAKKRSTVFRKRRRKRKRRTDERWL